MDLIDKYLNEQTGTFRRGLGANNIISEIKKLSAALSQSISKKDERAFKINLNSLEALIKELRKTNVFPE